jgi:spore germination cell wall hydrolase CwlJ-like protein
MTREEHAEWLKSLRSLTTADLLATLIYGEADGRPEFDSDDEKIAIGWVVKNRVVRQRESYANVILKHKQFSCFNYGSWGLDRLQKFNRTHSKYKPIHKIAETVINGVVRDKSNGADHYLTIPLTKILSKTDPHHWCFTMKLCATWSDHIFLRA